MEKQDGIQKVFCRSEKKYLLNLEQYGRMWALLFPHMRQEERGKHTIHTIYYDGVDFPMIRRCLEKPTYREKLRLRCYGIPKPGEMAYMELKKKVGGITYKRRIGLPYEDALLYLDHGIFLGEMCQIQGEIHHLIKRYRPEKKVLLSYDRIAYHGIESKNLRITFDERIRWRDHALDVQRGDFGQLLLPGDVVMMEIKTDGGFPLWLARGLSRMGVYPAGFSKYGTVYKEYLGRREAMQNVG
ncbi:polyphosphate polymerase domain-containing protein [Eubacteriales bacterium OttesenSCG-928-M02]|nr:polyphosphate polymerase domain-containing protein [Eubacteriales bacterium OttesenSCG-928-M02]